MAETSKILIIGEDNIQLRILCDYLTGKGFEVQQVFAAQDAYDHALSGCYDLNILDLDITDYDVQGLAVCKKLREMCISPILALTARGNSELTLNALNMGVDEILEKPYSMENLLASVHASLRLWSEMKYRIEDKSNTKSAKGITINVDKHEVKIKGKVVHLTPTEFKILHYLMNNEGRVVTHSELEGAIWRGTDSRGQEGLRTLISQLRKKIEEDHKNPKHIFTEAGIGYLFVSGGK